MKKIRQFLAAAVGVAALSVSCTDETGTSGSSYNPIEAGTSEFVVVTKVGDAYYYLTAESLSEGSVSVVNNGVEGNSITEYAVIDNNALYTVADGGGSNPAPVTKYTLSAAKGRVQQADYYSTVKYEAWGQWGGSFIHMAPLSDSDSIGQDYCGDSFDSYTVESSATDTGSSTVLAGTYYPYYLAYSYSDIKTSQYALADNFLGTGETVAFSGFVEAGDYVYVGVVPMYATPWAVENYRTELEATLANIDPTADLDDYIARGYGRDESTVAANNSLTTWANAYTPASGIPFPLTVDSCYVAVYSKSDRSFDNPVKIIRSGEQGAALARRVRNPRSSMTTGKSGDVYVFAPGGLRKTSSEFPQYYNYDSDNSTYSNQIENLKLVKGEKGASVMRIKAGATEFDSSFGNGGVVDLEAITGSLLAERALTRVFHVGQNKFLLRIMNEEYTLANGCYNTMHKSLYDTTFAILDLGDNGENPTITEITGLPAYDEINSGSASAAITDPFCKYGVAYIPIGYAAGGAQIYVVNTNYTTTYEAKKGLYVNTDYIMGVGEMIAQ